MSLTDAETSTFSGATYLTTSVSGRTQSVGAAAVGEVPGYYPADDVLSALVIVTGCHDTPAAVRAAYRAQFGTPCPI